jgi:NAD(P)-dependent dehydrogenase (short-subunit alcohol dehydrogenase family)
MNMCGRRVMITGATGHLGRMMANTLGEMGAELLLVDRPGSDFLSIEREMSERWQVTAQSLAYDFESEEARLGLIDIIKADGRGLNCLINNAAFVGVSNLQGWAAPFEAQTLDTWRRAIEVNLTAVFHLSQGLTPELRASRGGNIINITSIYGEFGPDWRLYEDTTMGNPAAYSASKGGLVQLTRWLATTLAPHIRVNAISPGGVLRDQPETFVQRYVARTPLARMANEDDFRGAVAYLASDLAGYVTGQVLRVDGGWGEW